MRLLSAALFVLALLPAVNVAAAPSDDVIRQKIVGSWGKSLTCADGSLTFNADGSFVSKGADGAEGTAGTYAIDQGQLTGKTGDSEMPMMLVDFDGDTLLLNDSGNSLRFDRCQAAQ
jgi:hypothetical protein